ncbi:MAG: imidazole glycerol phosphate synthase subunit HisH [Pseudomarimonas sp.]
MMRVVVIDSGGANIGSVCYALERLSVSAVLTADADLIRAAERVILPGVGAAVPAMARLNELGLVATIRSLQQPLLGICLGMQLLFERSEEGDVECLGLLPGVVRKLTPAAGIRVPHMGWNRLQPCAESRLLNGVDAGAQAYFVHSYAAPVTADCIASCEHGQTFAAMVERGKVAGAQFHPERSASVGARILMNFLQ